MNVYCIGNDAIVRHGALELRRYAAKIAGVDLNVMEAAEYPGAGGSGSAEPGIWLGTREQFGDVFADPGLSHPLDDGFYIRSVVEEASASEAEQQSGANGAAGKGHLLLAGVNERSVLYAVYAYLESLGCRWIRPGAGGTCCPKASGSRWTATMWPNFPTTATGAFASKAAYRWSTRLTWSTTW